MRRFKGSFLSTRVLANGCQVSSEALDSILKYNPETPISMDFSIKVIGRSLKITRVGDELVCLFDLNATGIPALDQAYLVASIHIFESHESNGVYVIDEARLMELAITYYPLDSSLNPIVPSKEIL